MNFDEIPKQSVIIDDLSKWLDKWPYFTTGIIEFIIDDLIKDWETGIAHRQISYKGESPSLDLRQKFGIGPRAKCGQYLSYLTDEALTSGYSPMEILRAFVDFPIFQNYKRRDIAQQKRTTSKLFPYVICYGGSYLDCDICNELNGMIWEAGKETRPTLDTCPNIHCTCAFNAMTKEQFERR